MNTLPIRFTEEALREISGIVRRKKIPESYGLRVGASGTGCSGVKFIIGFDSEKPGDSIFHIDGIQVLIEKKHFLFLAGLKIDFLDSDTERGFVFEADTMRP